MQIQNPVKQYKITEYGQYSCQYHIVFCTKYNRRLFTDEYIDKLESIFKNVATICDINLVEIMIMPNFVHLIIDCSPELSIQKTVNKFKSLSAGQLFSECPELKSRMPQIWTRKSFISTVGTITNDSIYNYIENQKERCVDG